MDMLEVCLKVKKNENGFIPVTIHLPSSSTKVIFVHVDPFFEALPHIGYTAEKHGQIPWLACGNQSVEAHSPSPLAQRTLNL